MKIGFDELMRQLLDHEADKDLRDRDGKRAYDYYVTRHDNEEILDRLA